MRDCFGDGRLVRLGDGYGIEALGLHQPAQLLPTLSGPLPDLSNFVGQVLAYAGSLEAIGGKQTQDRCRIHLSDLYKTEGPEPPISPMWAVVSGNIAGEPELRNESRYTVSLAYSGSGENSSWLRLTISSYVSVSTLFAALSKGDPVVVAGSFETYNYNDKDRLQLSIRRWQRQPRSGAPKPPLVLLSTATEADVAADSFLQDP